MLAEISQIREIPLDECYGIPGDDARADGRKEINELIFDMPVVFVGGRFRLCSRGEIHKAITSSEVPSVHSDVRPCLQPVTVGFLGSYRVL